MSNADIVCILCKSKSHFLKNAKNRYCILFEMSYQISYSLPDYFEVLSLIKVFELQVRNNYVTTNLLLTVNLKGCKGENT